MKQAGIIFLLIIIVLTGFIRFATLIQPVDRDANYKESINIKYGSSSQKIAELLYKNNLIRSKFLFNFLINISGYESKLKAGYYKISPGDDMWGIVKTIRDGRVAIFRVTIPEGSTLEEIAAKMADNTFYSRDEFLTAAGNMNYEKEYLVKNKENVNFLLEGFLYPETYIIPKGYNPHQIFKIMLKEFEKKWYNKLKKVTEESNYKISEIITIASLVEKEAKLDKEKPIIADVILNRLEDGIFLQVDATIQYALDSRKDRLLYSDLKVESLYNTYRYKGLPPGPICSPGDKAIAAVLDPVDTDYLFYFAREDGSHIFSENYSQHISRQNDIEKE